MFCPKFGRWIFEKGKKNQNTGHDNFKITTRVALTMARACTSQLVMVIGLTGVQICNHTSDLYIKSIITDSIGRCIRSPIPN